MEPSREVISERIKELRQKKDLTQEQLSSLCNYSRTYIGKIERGEKSPSLETLIRLADALNTDLASLFQEEGSHDYAGGHAKKSKKLPSVFNQFNYIIGVMDPDGIVERMRMIPWSYHESKLKAHGRKLWQLDIVESIEKVEAEIREGIENASLGESVYYHMKDTTNESNIHMCDLAIHPLSEQRGEVLKLGFEYFWPNKLQSNGQLALTDALFNSIEKITDEEEKVTPPSRKTVTE
ncbi:MAG: helix-turn-helix domain-containing protein [bacterium]